ncbi:uncharacterized protein LOC119344545 isoform X2 [Triticum dicoccoides]|nr:uncharacterized protein LOC119344545 isoform X2 [Triticum dicoccoides]
MAGPTKPPRRDQPPPPDDGVHQRRQPPPGRGGIDPVVAPATAAAAVAVKEKGKEVVTVTAKGEEAETKKEEDKLGEMKCVQVLTKRIRRHRKRLDDIRKMREKGKPLNDEQLADEAHLAAVMRDLEYLINGLKDACIQDIDSALHEKSSKDRGRRLNKTRAMLKENVEDLPPLPSTSSSSGTPQISWLGVSSSASDDLLRRGFWCFFGSFKMNDEMEEFYIGEAISLSNRQSKFFCVHYKHLEMYDKNLAIGICTNRKRLKESLEDVSRQFVMRTLKEMLPRDSFVAVRDIVERLRLKFVGIPDSHEKLATFLTREMVIWYVYERRSFPSPNVDGFLMFHGILAEIVNNHKHGRSWNGHFERDDIEVYNGKFFKIIKPAVYIFDPSQMSLEVAGFLKNDFGACKFLIAKFNSDGRLPVYFIQLEEALTETPVEEFLHAFDSDLYDKILHHPGIKHPFVRAQFLCGTYQACRAHDRYDPEAKFKEVLYNFIIPSLDVADAMIKSGIDILEKVLYFQQEQVWRALDKGRGPEVRMPLPGNKFRAWNNKAAFFHSLLTDDINYASNDGGTYISIKRHLIAHGPDYSKEEKVFIERGTGQDDGVGYLEVQRGSKSPRKQRLDSIEVLEIMGAFISEDALAAIISELLDMSAMTGK